MGKKFLDVELYTDGACSNNPGAGGWGFVLKCKNKEKHVSGYEEYTTNNRMELLAVIMGVRAVNNPCNLTIYTDSAYVYNAFDQNWIGLWQNNGFKNSQRKPVANKDLWVELIDNLNLHNYKFVKVKGHSDDYYNNICDKLATTAIKEKAGVTKNMNSVKV